MEPARTILRTIWCKLKLGILVACLSMSFSVNQAMAACCLCEVTVGQAEELEWNGPLTGTTPFINQFVTDEFTGHRTWIVSTLFEDNILPAMMMMTEQLSAVAMLQMQVVGSFFDAKHQMETQQVFQTLQAQAHKDYHPSVGMCEFGSAVKSLAATERKGEYNAVLMAQRSQDRALGNAYTAAAGGSAPDKEARLLQFREKFCDPADNNSGLAYMCEWDQSRQLDGDIGAEDLQRANKDIDFVRTVDAPWTINVDFTDETLTDHEEEVLALASNLYSHDLFTRPPPTALRNFNDRVTAPQKFYMDSRAIIAKSSVAENSFNALTAMKSRGTSGSTEYLKAILAELLEDPEEVERLIGNTLADPADEDTFFEPSYYAQMEILTKKVYQNPNFYTNLYDTPVNVERKNVAMQATALMQKFDLFKSALRKEASISVLLELAVIDLQNQIENEFNQMRSLR